MRKTFSIIGWISALWTAARAILNEIGYLQTAYDIASRMPTIIDWAANILLWPWSGPIVAVACVATIYILDRRRAYPSATIRGAAIPSTPLTNTTPTSVNDRIFVDVTPEDLMDLFENHTSIQASKLVSAFIGKWIPKVSGQFSDIHPISSEHARVTFPILQSDRRRVFMSFRGNYWIDRLSVLKPNDQITVLGQIKTVDRVQVELDNCELA